MVKDGHFSFQTQLPRLKSKSLQEKEWFEFLQFFLSFCQHSFFASWFSFRLNSNFSSAWHDNQFFFFFFFFCFCFFFFLMVCLLRATTHIIDGLPAWSISSHMRTVLKGLAFWFEVARITSVQRKIWLKSIFWEMGNFLSICLEVSIKVISEYHNLWILFCSLKRFGRFETVASLDAYQIINYQFLQKFIIFCCLISKEFEK